MLVVDLFKKRAIRRLCAVLSAIGSSSSIEVQCLLNSSDSRQEFKPVWSEEAVSSYEAHLFSLRFGGLSSRGKVVEARFVNPDRGPPTYEEVASATNRY